MKEDKIKELLSKYWDLITSDASLFLKKTENTDLEEQK